MLPFYGCLLCTKHSAGSLIRSITLISITMAWNRYYRYLMRRKRKACRIRWDTQCPTARKWQEQGQQLKYRASINPHYTASFQNSNQSHSSSRMFFGFYCQKAFLWASLGYKELTESPRLWPSLVMLRMPVEGQWVSLWKARKGKACCSPVFISVKIIMHFLLFGGKATGSA